jgi:protein involved in polysaccharide export with SLBB domain
MRHCGSLPGLLPIKSISLMFKTFTPSVRNAFQVLILAVLATSNLQAQAQLQLPAATTLQGGPPNAGALPGGATGPGSANGPGVAMPAFGLVQAPVMPPRSDLGAADAPRNPQAALRTGKPPAVPSQFQRFVQESTGKLLPNFGAQLFENPLAYSADAAAPAPGEYVLGPGDEVRIQIWGAVDYAGNQTLDRNGQISLPKVGVINLNGVQVKDLDATLRKQVTTVFTNVTVNASLGKLRGITVYVVGQAQQPGTYNLNSLSTLVNAIFASGGPTANGSMRNIRLMRGGKTVTKLDLYAFIVKGDKSDDAQLQPGDVIMIPPVGPRIALTGATDHAAIYEVKARTTIFDVLSWVGGVPAMANKDKAQIESIGLEAKGTRQVASFELTEQGMNRTLRDGDVITLLPMSPEMCSPS